MNFTSIELGASIIFAIAVLHTFCTGYFESLSKHSPRHAGLWHLLGEVEIVFGFWAAILVIYISLIGDLHTAKSYLNNRNFTEPLFVSPYSATSLREYFSEGFENYYMGQQQIIMDLCPELYNKIKQLEEIIQK